MAPASGFTKPRLIAAAIVIAGAILIAIAFPLIRRWSRAERAIDATTLSIGTVARGDLVRDVSVQGHVVAALHPTLTSPAQGIVAVRTKAGTVVRKGDVLAIVDSPELRSALDQARAQELSLRSDYERQKIASSQLDTRGKQQVALAEVKLEAAKRTLQRAELLHREGLMNGAEYERSKDELRIAELELAQAKREIGLSHESADFDVKSRKLQAERQQAAVAELQKRFDDLTIRAPFDGLIAALPVNDRDSVTANAPVVSVVNLSSLELELLIPEEYAADTKIGTPVSIAYGAEEQAGHITAVSPEIVGNQVTARAVPDRGWPEGMKQNQRVTTRLVFESKRDVLKVPRGAFVESGGGRLAYVVEGEVAMRREIELGAISASEVEIVRGLRQGERIIVSDTSGFGDARTIILH